MAIKQTQTKVFDFSDVGLDFCVASRALIPDRFEKMLSTGYNLQTVNSVSISGDQITFTYGGAHNYVSDRVLKVEGGPLASINNGEFRLDSVTPTTVTFTLEGSPSSIPGGFNTYVAPLGWDQVYKEGLVHIYKMKYLDERDLYVRMLFAPADISQSSNIQVCVGKSFDPNTGVIDDPNAYPGMTDTTEWVASTYRWLLETGTSTGRTTYTYSQGYSSYGRGVVIGSQYHLLVMANMSSTWPKALGAILPFSSISNHEALDYPLVIATYTTRSGNGSSSADGEWLSANGPGFLGAHRIHFWQGSAETALPTLPTAVSSALPPTIDSFNTTTAAPIPVYERSTRQFLGFVSSGLYMCQFGSSGAPSTDITRIPDKHIDADIGVDVYIHMLARASSLHAFFAAPVEEIKIG